MLFSAVVMDFVFHVLIIAKHWNCPLVLDLRFYLQKKESLKIKIKKNESEYKVCF